MGFFRLFLFPRWVVFGVDLFYLLYFWGSAKGLFPVINNVFAVSFYDIDGSWF